MKGLVITTDSLMRTEEYTTPLHESIGKTVGGWIEVVHPKLLPAPYCMIVNEEGLLLGLPVNLLGSILYESFRHGNPIVGNIVFCKEGFVEGERDIIGLDDDDLKCLGALISAVSGGAVKWESEAQYVSGTDYNAYYSGEHLVVELLSTGSAYSAEQVNIAYNKVKASVVTTSDIASAMENVELCLTLLGVVPDLLCAPGYSQQSTVAAAMTAKAGNINGLFRAKALIDIDCGASGARSYSDVLTKKNAANISDEDEIALWPMLKLGEYKFHMSTQLAGLMAQIDTDNGGCPYESPSNKGLQCDGLCLEDGTEVNLTLAQANYLNGIGVDTALNFMSGWVAWGNYTACYPSNTDVKDYFIPVSRMFGWVGNSLVKTFWSKLDKPMNRRLIDTVLDTANIWLNGLVGMGYLLGARVEMLESENPLTNLMAGIIKLHVYMTPPSPAQEIDFVLEYDASYVTSALQG